MAFIRLTFIPAPSLSPGGGCTQRSVIWRPGGVASCDVATTWADVEVFIAAAQGLITVFVDGSIISPALPTIPPGTDTECFGRVTLKAYTLSTQGFGSVLIADGGRLRNLAQVESVSLSAEPGVSGIIPLLIDIPGVQLIARNGGRIELGAAATISMIQVAANSPVLAGFQGGLFLNGTGNPAIATVSVDPAITQIIFAMIEATGTFLPFSPPYGANFLSGGNGATQWIRIWDASAPPVAQPLFLGSPFDLPLSNAIGTVYQNTLVTPFISATEVQGVLDILKRRVTGFGNTASRPAIPADIDTGGMYFDTDVGFPVYSNGAIYVDAAGAPA